MKPTEEFIEENDEAKITKYECNFTKCHNSAWCCEKCSKSTNANFEKGATRHKKSDHSNKK